MTTENTEIGVNYPFQNPDLTTDERIENLISLLTLQEKLDCLSTDPVVSRLGFAGTQNVEGLHGLVLTGQLGGGNIEIPTTAFPQPIGMAQSWDPALIRQVGAAMGREARYVFHNKQYGQSKLLVMAPNADLGRDPRWGRNEECYGEDAFLNGTLAVELVRGLQGDHSQYWQVAALLKHFLANSNEDERLRSSSNFDERLFREYYSVPFRMAVTQGGASSLMAAYNAYNGVPCTVHPMLKEVVIREWGLNGIICTDFLGMSNLVDKHYTHPDKAHAAADSLKAGVSQFLEFPDFRQAVAAAVTQNLLTEVEIDQALRRNFRVMHRLGLLDPVERVPFAAIAESEPPWESQKHQSLAREITRKSIVLLKNEGNLLPLNQNSLKSIAVIGPLADRVLTDLYSGLPPYLISPLKGIRNKLGGHIEVLTDSTLSSTEKVTGIQPGIIYQPGRDNSAAIELAKNADIAIVCIGNNPWCGGWAMGKATPGLPSEGMEALDRQTITLEQEELIQQVYAANQNMVVVLVTSFPYAINWTQAHVPAILHMAHGSQELGIALADVLFGDYNPAGRLVETWPQSLDQLPPLLDYDIRHGRTYLYFEGEPLYPFGYGLSYTQFAYSNLRLSHKTLGPEETLSVNLDVTNTGELAGEEVVQLYVKHLNSVVARPQKELKGFVRISIEPGETKNVRFELKVADLAYWNSGEQGFMVEAGTIKIQVGASSVDIRLQENVAIYS